MNRRIYLDYNASTPLDPRVAKEMAEKTSIFGNPSSIHAEGREARALVDEARVAVSRLLNCDHRQILFTSGGTEANNLAILGVARAKKQKGSHMITSAIEHSSVMNACKQLQKEGWDVTFIKPTVEGLVEIEAVADAIRDDTVLLSIMMANNEIGTLQPIAELAAIAHDHGVLMHTDAIQALGKIPVDTEALGVDLLTVSAHKIYGPKGAGALYFAPSVELAPLLRGGSHEKGLRAGTENVSAIHGFGVACNLLREEGPPDLMPLRNRLEEGLARTTMKILCQNSPRLPNTVNFYSGTWHGESMVMAFDLEGIAVSNGSACSAGIIEPSHVVSALGYNDSIARSVIRVSFGKFTRTEDVDSLLQVIHALEKVGGGS